jgi:hypothetical protein
VPYGWSGVVIPCKAEYVFSPQSKSYASVTSNQAQDYTALAIGIVTISGAIKTSGGTGIAGVDIIAASKRSSTGATTDADGNYQLTITAGVGDVNVTPSKTGYTFSPDYVTYDIDGPRDRKDENYTAIPAETVIITGCVITSNGVVIPNVTIAPSNGPVIMTDVYGSYMLAVPKNRSVTVTPLKQGFTFVPSESTYIDIAESKSQNYIAAGPPVTISGYIRTADGTAISGATVTPTGGSAVTTGSDGYYQLSLPSGWSGTVTPGKSGYIFSPASQSYRNVSADQTQDYTGTLGQVKISGSIKLSDGTAISGVTLTATNGGVTTTDANGYYQLTVDSGWSGTITPAKTGYKFNPASQSFTNVISDQIQDYTGIKVYAISGYVRDSADSGISGITLTATNDGGADATDANGYYQLAVPEGWSGTVAPSGGIYRFFVLSDTAGGATRSYTNVASNQSGQNYLGQAPWRGLAMVSIPIIPGSDNPRDVIGFTGESLVTYDIAISDYKYVWNDMTIFDPSATEALLTGFWAKFQADTLVQVPAGDIPAQDQPVTIPLAGGGWNLIGQPFMRAVKWDTSAIKVRKADDTIISLSDPSARDIVLDYLWGWRPNPSSAARGEYYLVWTASTSPGITNKMLPWQSYWIYAYKDCSLILPPPETLADP